MGDVVDLASFWRSTDRLPALRPAPARALVTIFSPELALDAVRAAMRLRAAGIDVELYPEPAKMAKQFRYADQLGHSLRDRRRSRRGARSGQVALKDLASGEQVQLTLEEAAERLR